MNDKKRILYRKNSQTVVFNGLNNKNIRQLLLSNEFDIKALCNKMSI